MALLLLLVTTACYHSNLEAADGQSSVRDFFNVVAPEGADPWVIKHTDGLYYWMVTTGSNVTLRRSSTISALGAGESKVIYRPPPQLKHLWAPEIHRLAGKWYVYVAADDGNNATHRMYVLENASANPFDGQFTMKGKISDPASDLWAIDATVLTVKDRLYLVWSGWEGTTDVAQNLYIAPMLNPWTLGGPRVLISQPTLPWEKRGGPPSINEGPQILLKDDRIYLVYSAAGSWTNHYCLGLLSARVGDDLLAASSWKKHQSPVFESANHVFGPGHCSFVKSPDDRQDWIIYHSARRQGSGWSRLVRAQQFHWNPDGSPNFGEPAPPDQPIALPGGEPVRLRVEAESATLTGTARVSPHPTCSAGSKVGYIDTDDSSATIPVSVARTGPFLLVIRSGNGTDSKVRASQILTVNKGKPITIPYQNNGWDNWSNVYVKIDLKAGENQLKFAHDQGFAEIDCIDLIPQP